MSQYRRHLGDSWEAIGWWVAWWKDRTLSWPVYPPLGPLSMDHLLSIQRRIVTAKAWSRYFDDTFSVIEEVNTKHFLDHLNSFASQSSPSWSWRRTVAFHFLTLLTRREASRTDIQLYQKPTHRLITALYFSPLLLCQKSVASCLLSCARRVA